MNICGRPFDVLSEPEDSSDSEDSFTFTLGANSIGHSSASISSLGSYDSDAMEEDMNTIYNEMEIEVIQNEANMMCDMLHRMANDIITPGDFFMMKMLDRPPRYEDIGKDRKVPFDIDPDEPPPLYAAIFCPYPAMFQHDSPERPTNDEMEIDMVQPNYFMLETIEEEPIIVDEAIDQIYDEIIQSEPIDEIHDEIIQSEPIDEIHDEIIQSEPIREINEFPLPQNSSG